MATYLRPKLPMELIPMVLAYSNIQDLCVASLVSHQWHHFAFPYLYCNVTVSRIPHLETLISRLESKTLKDASGLGQYIRSLCIDLNEQWPKSVTKKHPLIPRLKLAIPKLVRLEHLQWKHNYYDLGNLFECFRASCPKLRMFTRSITPNPYAFPGTTRYLPSWNTNLSLENRKSSRAGKLARIRIVFRAYRFSHDPGIYFQKHDTLGYRVWIHIFPAW